MSKLQTLIKKAEHSSFGKWILNLAMSRAIPFNAPHNFKIVEVSIGQSTVMLPYKKKNLNHVKGIHACGLATLCEFAVGMTLMSMISEQDYRIVLKNIKVDYHYRAKTDVFAKFNISKELVEEKIINPLKNSDAVFVELEVSVYDTLSNHICTGYVNWQLKKWDKVRSL